MTEGQFLDRLTALVAEVSPDVARRAVTSLADKLGVSAGGSKRRALSGDDDEDEEDEHLDYQSSLGTSESVNLTKHDRTVRRIMRG
jgi:hypothetical protein